MLLYERLQRSGELLQAVADAAPDTASAVGTGVAVDIVEKTLPPCGVEEAVLTRTVINVIYVHNDGIILT
jgi:hypothetical protein